MRRILSAVLFLTLATPLIAQTPATQSTKAPAARLLLIGIERVKPGKSPAHRAMETQWTLAQSQARRASNFVALNRGSGPEEVWYVFPHASFTEMQDSTALVDSVPGLRQKLDAFNASESEYLESVQRILAELQPELSLGDSVDYRHAHGYHMWVFRVRIGHEAEFADWVKLWVSGARKAGVAATYSTYLAREGVSGDGEYLIFRPFHSFDEYAQLSGENDAALGALTADDRQRTLSEYGSSVSAATEATMWVDPQQSFVPESFAQADPAFWKTNVVFAAMQAKKTATQAGRPRTP